MAAISSHYRIIMESPNVENYKVKVKKATYTGEAMTKDTMSCRSPGMGHLPNVQYGTTEAGPISMDFMGFDDWIYQTREPR